MNDAYICPDIEYFSLAELICRRPKMYTASGALSEVIALLEGYEMVYGHLPPLDPQPPYLDDSPLRALDWLAQAIDIDRGPCSISSHVDDLMNRFGSNESALKELCSALEAQRKAAEETNPG